MSRRRRGLAVAAVVVCALAAGCGGHSTKRVSGPPAPAVQQPSSTAGPVELGRAPSTIARAAGGTVDVYTNAGDPAPAMSLRSPTPDGVPRVFLVMDTKPGWLHVLLPVPPNGSQGWLPASEVTTATTTYWLRVLRSAHRLRLYRAAQLVLDVPAAIGTTDTPTPGGSYYLTELLQPPDPNGAYGPYAYGLSGYSTTLSSFNGHDPVIGIHGTNQPKLLGTSVSHGCVRVSNATITRLAKILPLGTPVQISA